MNYDNWKLTPPEATDYDYSQFKDLPYEYVEKAERWRDVETKEFVSESKAIDGNDGECEKQIENQRDMNRYYDREIY